MCCHAVQAMLSPSAKAETQSKQRETDEPQIEDNSRPLSLLTPLSPQGEALIHYPAPRYPARAVHWTTIGA